MNKALQVYAELYFTDVLWPDFDEKALISGVRLMLTFVIV